MSVYGIWACYQFMMPGYHILSEQYVTVCCSSLSQFAVRAWCRCRLSGHVTLGCQGMMLLCSQVMSVYPVRASYRYICQDMSVYGFWAYCHTNAPCKGIMYMLSGLHASAWCHYHVNVCCQSLISLYTDTAFRALKQSHYRVTTQSDYVTVCC